MRKDIKVGIIGYGLSGKVFHAPIIGATEGLQVTKVVTSRREEVRRDWPQVSVTEEPKDLIMDPDIDLVVIATPNTLHYPLAKEALQAGKHAVVEKPFTIHSEEGEELARIAEEKGLALSVYHNRRWDNDFLTIKSCMEQGHLGEVHTWKTHYHRYRPLVRDRWRETAGEGAGTLFDLGSHLIDQALHLFGEPDTVWGDVLIQRDGAGAPDYFHLVLGYGDYRRVDLRSSSIVKGAGPRFEVHGSKGSFIKYGLDGQEEALKQGAKPGDAGWGEDDPCNYGQLTLDRHGETVIETVPTLRGCYEEYYRQIRDALTHGAPVPVTAGEATRVIRVIERAMESSRTGRALRYAIG
ncbi:oxidoreductase [Salinithrix halophila]|uniref:Oxidoreductase n=1 Tax=Salinithrix halophila TaxID=1485204 RepID=A0ABV8JC58_9BACL